ncbi:MAG TPA: P-II family nitrogen regulator [Nitrososphaeraceae archaeon]|nr:P-II family nitrogen regulator [Nitrososphaeraceae archaeon]
MKKIDLILSHEHFLEVSQLLHKHKIDGMTFYSVKGRGHSRKEEVSAGTGMARIVPEFVAGTKIELLVQDSEVQSIIMEVRTTLSKGSFPFGKIFVSDILEVHDINT